MPKNIAKEEVNLGETIFSWSIKEYQKYERDRRWYFLMIVLGVFLIFYAIWTADYLFALIIILFAIIIFMSDLKEPAEIPFVITNTGVLIGNNFYQFKEFSGFWIIYNPPDVKNLYFSFDKILKHRVMIPLLDYDPRPVRDELRKYLEEDLEKDEEPLSDRISRLFRIH